MTQLSEEICTPCRINSPAITNKEIAELRPLISDWNLILENGVSKLDKTYMFRGFSNALKFTITIASLAEDQGHHPRLVTEWGKVRVTWWTHKIRGLHRNDFIMASKTDSAAIISEGE
jgi:4a-hydroxytetrahydrobiopterin dehydratase